MRQLTFAVVQVIRSRPWTDAPAELEPTTALSRLRQSRCSCGPLPELSLSKRNPCLDKDGSTSEPLPEHTLTSAYLLLLLLLLLPLLLWPLPAV